MARLRWGRGASAARPRSGNWLVKGSRAAAANGRAGSMGLELLDGGVKTSFSRQLRRGQETRQPFFCSGSEMANWGFSFVSKKGDPPCESAPAACGGALGVVVMSGSRLEDSLKKEDFKKKKAKQKNKTKKMRIFFFPL